MRGGAALLAACGLLLAGGVSTVPAEQREGEGYAGREPASRRPTVEAAFDAESYRPGQAARLVVFDRAPRATLRLHRVTDVPGLMRRRDVMRGSPVGPERRLGRLRPGTAIRLRLPGSWPSGLYYAELTAPGDRVGYAPFVLAPPRLGRRPVAVVLPTQTWQAYNHRDDDGDGAADTWYADPLITTARLHRPFGNRGVPPHYQRYDEPFLRWLARHGREVDYLSDRELRTTSGDRLARAYNLLVFPGHHEYVTTAEYDAVVRFRNLGGNLAFLSANNFFYRVTIAKGVMTRAFKWRALGRPEAALVGIQYFGSMRVGGPWRLRDTRAGRWIFAGTGLRPGSMLAYGGTEADRLYAQSPRGIQVLAEIRHVFGGSGSAQMTYYRRPGGAQVFAAGAFTLAGAVWQPPVSQTIENLLDELAWPSARLMLFRLADPPKRKPAVRGGGRRGGSAGR